MRTLVMLVLAVFMSSGTLLAQDKGVKDHNYCTFQDSKVIVYTEGKASTLTTELKLDNGTTVFADGSYTTSNNKKHQLKDDECLGMSGDKYKSEAQLFQKLQQRKKKLMKG